MRMHRFPALRSLEIGWASRVVRIALVALLSLAGCGDDGEPGPIVQFSTLSALQRGELDSIVDGAELVEYGDLGLGAFEGLDGEMILFDGVVYQARIDGSVTASPFGGMSFATAVEFEPDISLEVGAGVDFASLGAIIDTAVPDRDIPCAIRVTGEFADLAVRSVPGQTMPYPTLAEVVAQQVVFNLNDISGGLAGFRMPASLDGINVGGFHFHFISSDRTAGGHVLSLESLQLTVEVDLRDDVAVLRTHPET